MGGGPVQVGTALDFSVSHTFFAPDGMRLQAISTVILELEYGEVLPQQDGLSLWAAERGP